MEYDIIISSTVQLVVGYRRSICKTMRVFRWRGGDPSIIGDRCQALNIQIRLVNGVDGGLAGHAATNLLERTLLQRLLDRYSEPSRLMEKYTLDGVHSCRPLPEGMHWPDGPDSLKVQHTWTRMKSRSIALFSVCDRLAVSALDMSCVDQEKKVSDMFILLANLQRAIFFSSPHSEFRHMYANQISFSANFLFLSFGGALVI